VLDLRVLAILAGEKPTIKIAAQRLSFRPEFPRRAATHVTARFIRPEISALAAHEGLVVFPLSRYCLVPPTTDGLVLGFGGLSPRTTRLPGNACNTKKDYASMLCNGRADGNRRQNRRQRKRTDSSGHGSTLHHGTLDHIQRP